jgi:hypothetical protein
VIVATAWSRPRLAPSGAAKFTLNVSSASTASSPLTSTAIVFVVSPGAKVTEPFVTAA